MDEYIYGYLNNDQFLINHISILKGLFIITY